MYYRFFGQRNPEKDIERILVDLQGSGAAWKSAQTNFIPVRSGYDYDAGAPVFVGETVFSINPGVGLDSSTDLLAASSGIASLAGDITLTPIAIINGGATSTNVRLSANSYTVPAGSSGLSGQDDTDNVSQSTVAVPAFSGTNPVWEITDMNMTLTVAENSVIVAFIRRDGGGAGDSYTGILEVLGWRIA